MSRGTKEIAQRGEKTRFTRETGGINYGIRIATQRTKQRQERKRSTEPPFERQQLCSAQQA